jgi:hypothetical protein
MASRLLRAVASCLMLNATFPVNVLAQTPPPIPARPAAAQPFSKEQLDALVASIALYPDDLLTQLLWPRRSRLKSWPRRAGWRTWHTSQCPAMRWPRPWKPTHGTQLRAWLPAFASLSRG